MSNLLTAEVKEVLTPLGSGITLIITIGNDLRSDDGVGPYIAKKFKNPDGNVLLLDAGDKPENIIDKAVSLKPKKVIIVDAAKFGGKIGEAKVIDISCIPNTTLTTHTFPLPIIAKILAEDTGQDVYFIGIEPMSVEFGKGLSSAVKDTADAILKFIKRGD
jgi:hydrogenase 3 maturation protease